MILIFPLSHTLISVQSAPSCRREGVCVRAGASHTVCMWVKWAGLALLHKGVTVATLASHITVTHHIQSFIPSRISPVRSPCLSFFFSWTLKNMSQCFPKWARNRMARVGERKQRILDSLKDEDHYFSSALDSNHSPSPPIEKVTTIMWHIEVVWMLLLPHAHDYRPLKSWTKQVLEKRAVIMTHLSAILSLYKPHEQHTCVFLPFFNCFQNKTT